MDDDSYVRVSSLLELLGQLPHEHIMVGNIGEYAGKPNRNFGDAWSVSLENWGREEIPLWASGGGGYVLSMVHDHIIANISLHTNPAWKQLCMCFACPQRLHVQFHNSH